MGTFAFSAYYEDADNMRIPTHVESVAQLQSEAEEIPADRSQDAENTLGKIKVFHLVVILEMIEPLFHF